MATKFNPEKLWAQQVIRAKIKDEEYICALVRKKFEGEDVEMDGAGEYLGLEKEEIHPMTIDSDPDSETFGKRIKKQNTEATSTRLRFTQKYTPEISKEWQKMCGYSTLGKTEYIWKFREGAFHAEDDFWTTNLQDAYEQTVKGRQVIVIEKDKPNNTRTSTKTTG